MKHFALGRMKAGKQNNTEKAYGQLLELRKRAGEILWYAFEAVKLRLADNTFYTADYFVLLANGELEVHEVKGSPAIFADDAKVKVKVAASAFPFRFIVAYPIPKRAGGGWSFEEF